MTLAPSHPDYRPPELVYEPDGEPPWPDAIPIGARPRTSSQRDAGGRLETFTLAELLAEPTAPPAMLARGVLACGVAILAGPPKVGKSMLAMQLALSVGSIAHRPAFLGHPTAQGVVLYVAEEGSRDGIRFRAHRQSESLGIGEAAVEFLHRQRIRLDNPRSVEDVRAIAQRLAPALIVIDPLNRAHGRNEDRANEMTPVMEALSGLAYDFNCAVVVIHHVNKPSEGKTGQDRQRGSTAIRSGTEANLILDERDGALALAGEYRDGPDLSPLFVEMDPSTLLFGVRDRPEPTANVARKILLSELIDYVAGMGHATARQVQERFGVASVNTAKAVLLDAMNGGHLDSYRDGRTVRYCLPRA